MDLYRFFTSCFFTSCAALMWLITAPALAQEFPARKQSFPTTISIFSESVSLPNFRNIFQNAGLGIRIGTELSYSFTDRRQLYQTLNLGFYSHRNLHNGLYLSSEFGYRKSFGPFFADFTFGGGYLRLNSALPMYERQGMEYRRTESSMHKFMPTAGLGLGYHKANFSVFARQEIFAEMPFSYKGVPLLPHKAIHLGTRFNIH